MRIVTILLSVLLLCGATTDATAQTDHGAVYRMDMSADGTRFATSNVDGLALYDAQFNQLNFRAYASENDYLYSVPVFSPDGTRILVLNEIWDSTTLETVTTLPIDKGSEPRWSPDSQMILTLPRAAQIHSAHDGSLIRELPYWGYWWRAWGYDMTYFVTGGDDRILFMDATTGVEIASYVFPGETVGGPLWNSDGTRFALFTSRIVEPSTPSSHPIGSGTRAILYSLFFVDVSNGNRIHLEGLPSGIGYAAWSPDDQFLAGGSNASSLYVWDTTNGEVVESYALPPEKFITMLKYSPTGGRLVLSFVDSPVTANLVDTNLSATSTFNLTQLDGALQIFVPLATLARFAEIAVACDAPGTLTDFDTALTDAAAIVVQAQALLTAINALSEGAIPLSCAADLHAIAEAIIAETPALSCDTTITAGDVAALKTAITAANSAGSPQTICLSEGTYTLTSVDHSADGPNGLPSISGDVTLHGLAGGATITCDSGAPNFRILCVAGNGRLALENITISGGNPGGSNNGGGIRNLGTLELVNSTVEYNTARDGAGIRNNNNATLITTNSIIRNNTSPTSGGGLFSNSGSSTTLVDTRFEANIASASSGSGGAIFMNGASLAITDGILEANNATNGKTGKRLVWVEKSRQSVPSTLPL